MRFVAEGGRTGPLARRPLLSLSSFLLAIVVGLISSFTFSTAYDMARAALYGERQRVSGIWHGQWHGVRAVTIRLEQNGDALGGAASFTRIIATDDGPEASSTSPEIPLVNPRLDGKRLLFELRATDEIHPTIFIEMEMNFQNEVEAVLRCTRRDSEVLAGDEEETIEMVRERSF